MCLVLVLNSLSLTGNTQCRQNALYESRGGGSQGRGSGEGRLDELTPEEWEATLGSEDGSRRENTHVCRAVWRGAWKVAEEPGEGDPGLRLCRLTHLVWVSGSGRRPRAVAADIFALTCII